MRYANEYPARETRDAARGRRLHSVDGARLKSSATFIDHTQGNNERAWERLQRYFTVAGTSPESLRLASDIASAQGDSARAAFYRQQLGGS